MCLKTSPPQENTSRSTILVAVMSSGESNVASGTPTSSSSSPHQPISLSMGKSESSEKFRGDVASLDAVSLESEVGELKKESAQSAFEITSVEPAPDEDLDATGGRAHPTSMDDSTLKIKLESGDSEEDTEDQQHTPKIPSDVEPSGSSALSSSSGVDLSRSQQSSATGNGPSVQPGGGRFRKVNKYARGRWTVRDMETTEERSGTEIAARHASQGAAGSRTNVLEPGSGSPSVGRRTEQQESLHSRSGSELGQTSNASTITGGGGAPSDNVSDKDSTSVHLDRSSTAADTLSRNTSMSSINAPDDRSTDVDIDTQTVSNVSGEVTEVAGATGVAPTLASVATAAVTAPSHPPPHTSSTLTSSSESAAMTSTHQAREQPVSHLNGPLDSTADIQPSESDSVKIAMAHLQKQLEILLTSKTGMEQKNTKLHEQIHSLTEEVKRLRDENSELKQLIGDTASGQQASQLQDRNKALEEENLKLKTELKHLKTSLSMLVKGSSDSSSVDASQSSTQHT